MNKSTLIIDLNHVIIGKLINSNMVLLIKMLLEFRKYSSGQRDSWSLFPASPYYI